MNEKAIEDIDKWKSIVSNLHLLKNKSAVLSECKEAVAHIRQAAANFLLSYKGYDTASQALLSKYYEAVIALLTLANKVFAETLPEKNNSLLSPVDDFLNSGVIEIVHEDKPNRFIRTSEFQLMAQAYNLARDDSIVIKRTDFRNAPPSKTITLNGTSVKVRPGVSVNEAFFSQQDDKNLQHSRKLYDRCPTVLSVIAEIENARRRVLA